MKKILVTGFEPFGGQEINPSWEAVKALPDVIGNYEIHRLLLPVEYRVAAQKAIDASENSIHPDAILCVGQAGTRSGISLEKVGLNLRDTDKPDNAGKCPHDEPCWPGAPAALFATLPIRDMAEAIRARDIPAYISYSAGAFVCNDLYYTLLKHYLGCQIMFIGFIHVPFLPEQAGDKYPSMTLEKMTEALTAAIECLD